MADDAAAVKKSPHDGVYDESQIKVLRGMEAVRKRPGMYIGDTTPRGLHHLVWEIVDNAIDEAMAGRCDTIALTIHADGSATVVDNGDGIPVGIHPTEKISTLEVVFCQLHAGGKFDHGVYKVSGGLHGVGASVVNALSEWMEVEVCREGKVYAMKFERGVMTSELKQIGTRQRTGTKVTFMPDGEIFPDIGFRYEQMASRLRELAYLNEGVTIKLKDEREEKEDVFQYKQGLVAFVKHLNEGKQTLHRPIEIHREDPETLLQLDLVIQYNDSYAESVFSFANNINTLEGGAHLSGFRSALTRTMNYYARNAKLLKNGETPSGDDLREGLTALISVKGPEPQFEGQTKTKLGNSEVETFVTQAVTPLRLGHLPLPATRRSLRSRRLSMSPASAPIVSGRASSLDTQFDFCHRRVSAHSIDVSVLPIDVARGKCTLRQNRTAFAKRHEWLGRGRNRASVADPITEESTVRGRR